MQITRRMFRRIEIVEQIRVKVIGPAERVLFAKNSTVNGDKFFLQIFRSNAANPEKLFECDLHGKLEIEETIAGDFLLVCKTAPKPER